MRMNELYYKHYMSETTENNTYCCSCCKCVEDNKHIFKNKVLMNRIHKCRIVNILTETQYIEMYERMRNKQIETYKNIETMILILRTREKQIIDIIARG